MEQGLEKAWADYVVSKSGPGSEVQSVQERVKPWQFSVLRSIGSFILLAGFQDRLRKCGGDQGRAQALKDEIHLFSADNGIVNREICFSMNGVS